LIDLIDNVKFIVINKTIKQHQIHEMVIIISQ
jgi:hypothetical protein